MAEEEKNAPQETPEAADETPLEEASAEDASAEEAPEEASVEEAPAEEPEAEEPAEAEEPEEAPAEAEAADEPEPAAAEEEPAEALTPKQLRKRERSIHTGEPRPQRAPEERVAERAEIRRAKTAERRRRRAQERAKRGEPRTGTPPAERQPGTKKVQVGTVVSDKADKTITVRVDIVRRHRRYEKVVRQSATVHAHDERNEAAEGDVVRVVESRPLSRTKRWRLVDVVQKAPVNR